ncbi:MAG: hypothetical protein KGD68_02345 [Candidatus Lokiarchaeota archaeon]|nr:hypothetical protein [Candidatus Lokiarchaeota archaeon]
MKTHSLESLRGSSYNEHFIKEILSRFDFVSSILLTITGVVLLYFAPFLGYLIRTIASDVGYGSAKLFYFVVADFEFFLILGLIFLLLNGMLLFLAGLGFLKFRKWSIKIHYLSWIMVLLIFPIGTLYGAFTFWMSSKVNQ